MGLLQSIMITLVFRTLKHFRIVRFPDFSIALARQLFPIPIFYTINLVTGLGATKFITAPMFVVLRRFSIPLTLFLQYRILGIGCTRQAIFAISILLMGSLVAMMEDFSFNLIGYLLCFVNDMGDSFESILTKKQLVNNHRLAKSSHESEESLLESGHKSDLPDSDQSKDDDSIAEELDIGKVGILYYSAFFNVFPLLLLVLINGDLVNCFSFEAWMDPLFPFIFFSSSLLSVLFLYTWITCTDLNSPLLSQIVSCLRSILTTYIGNYDNSPGSFEITY
jgi:solute carrier family 35 protein